MNHVAVLGAGAGGCAAAAHLRLLGLNVALWNRTESRITSIRERGGIELFGDTKQTGFAEIRTVTTDMASVLKNADTVIVTVPASGHADVARECARYIRDDQTVILNPGYMSSIEFSSIVGSIKRVRTRIAETSCLTYTCRMTKPTEVMVFRTSRFILLSAFPGVHTEGILETLADAYAFVKPAINVFEAGLNNPNQIVHPTITILNAARIESGEDFLFYKDGVTHSVAKLIEDVDNERLLICKRMHFKEITSPQRAYMSGHASPNSTIYDVYTRSEQLGKVKAPSSLSYRFLTEDIPYGLVMWSSLARAIGVATPTIDSMVTIASRLNRTDYWNT